MTLTRLIARPLLASLFVVGGAGALRDAAGKVPNAEPVADKLVPLVKKVAPGLPIPTDTTTLVRINGAVQLLGGLALATGRVPRLSSTALALSLLPTTAAGHAFWDETDPEEKSAKRVHFVKNLSVLGGLLLAAVDTDGKPGLSWRAGRAAKDLSRETKRLARDARRETKLAAASVR